MRRPALIAFALTALAFATLGFSSSEALALGHVALGNHSQGDIKSHCDAAGGSFYNSSGTYGCFGPGGDVTCSGKNKKCFGTCEKCGSAARLNGKGGVGGFLTNPSGSKVGTTPTAPPPKGKHPPIQPIKTSGAKDISNNNQSGTIGRTNTGGGGGGSGKK